MAGTYLFTAQYLQLVSGLPVLVAALWLLPQTGADHRRLAALFGPPRPPDPPRTPTCQN